MSKKKELVLRRERRKEQYLRFAEEYFANGYKLADAAIAAGSTKEQAPINAFRWIRRPEVVEYLRLRKKRLQDNTDITFAWKMKKLKACIESSILVTMKDEEIVLDPKSVIAAIGELNKMQGHYAANQIEMTQNINITEIRATIEKLKKEY